MYFCGNNLLCEQQYGIRYKHSTELATIKRVDYLLKHTNDNQVPCAFYLDLSKAFDNRKRERQKAMAIKKERKGRIDSCNPVKNFTTFAQLKLFSYIFFANIVSSSTWYQHE